MGVNLIINGEAMNASLEGLLAVEQFQYAALLRVHLCEPAQTGHSLQESDAGPAESQIGRAHV